ncbi:MAG: hypothetical protein ACLVBC_17655 [Parabacteroides distasonis]
MTACFPGKFLQWFKDVDAKDGQQPREAISAIIPSAGPVAADQIPQYQEQIASFGQRIEFIGGYMIAMIVMIAVGLWLAFILYKIRVR